MESIIWTLQKHPSQLDLINLEPLYPTEKLIFNEDLTPSNYNFSNSTCLAIPKLNIQFLTLHDYLLRNFKLYKLETAYAIRQDIEDAVLRLAPRYNLDSTSKYDQTVFTGWSRNAVPVTQMQIEKIGNPR
jgi:intron-binding protein aquarius